jgi:UPF0755 protein
MKLSVINKLSHLKRALFGGFLLSVFLVSYWFWLDYRAFIKTPISIQGLQPVFEIEPGMGINRLAIKLKQQGSIDNPFYFKLLAYLHPELTKLKTGEYLLHAELTPTELLLMFNQGKVIQYNFTIVEGQTVWQILDNLANVPKLHPLTDTQQQDLYELLNIEQLIITEGQPTPSIKSIEGWLMPETYHYSKGESALELLRRATHSMNQVLTRLWHQRAQDLPYDSPYQALIMASIIEKETGIAAERPEIAGVFVRRLKKRMRLQTDPTVIYGIGPNFNGDITRKDLKTPTPYNTYVIRGLPPTPIAMPSEKAIHAALNPAQGNTLYFVADGTGGHYFSETLAEHQQAVIRMLKRNRHSN